MTGKKFRGAHCMHGLLTCASALIAGILILPACLAAQPVMGARAVSLGQANSALIAGDWALFSNPALLDTENSRVSFFGMRYYGFSELTDMAAAASFPTAAGVIAAGAHRYGFELFSETRLRMAYKNELLNFHYGAAVTYQTVAIGGGYGSASSVGFDAGIAAPVTGRLWLGAKATNLNSPEYGSSGEELPREMSVGMAYRLSKHLLLVSDVVKDVRFPLTYRGGIEAVILDVLSARAGATAEPNTLSAGIGYGASSWGINIAVQNHIDLGISPGMDLYLTW